MRCRNTGCLPNRAKAFTTRSPKASILMACVCQAGSFMTCSSETPTFAARLCGIAKLATHLSGAKTFSAYLRMASGYGI